MASKLPHAALAELKTVVVSDEEKGLYARSFMTLPVWLAGWWSATKRRDHHDQVRTEHHPYRSAVTAPAVNSLGFAPANPWCWDADDQLFQFRNALTKASP